MTIDFRELGGKAYRFCDEEIIDFGWRAPSTRTQAEQQFFDREHAAAPLFAIIGEQAPQKAGEKIILAELRKHPSVLASVGFLYPGMRQVSGSCVGVGGGNVYFVLSCVEVVRLGDPEQVLVPFWPFTYGRSRYHMGDRRPGEGSLASAHAKAAREDGIVPANLPGLPALANNDGLVLSEALEMSWSDGDADQTMRLLPQARKHLVLTTADIHSADQARDAIRNGYPMMFAGLWGGLYECPVTGDPPCLLNRRSGSWSHNQACIAWWDHPSLGELFGIWNTWGTRTHGLDPAGLPPGAYWIKRRDFEDQLRSDGEIIAYSQFEGFPGQPQLLDWTRLGQ